jgi:hypothetical protein
MTKPYVDSDKLNLEEWTFIEGTSIGNWMCEGSIANSRHCVCKHTIIDWEVI